MDFATIHRIFEDPRALQESSPDMFRVLHAQSLAIGHSDLRA